MASRDVISGIVLLRYLRCVTCQFSLNYRPPGRTIAGLALHRRTSHTNNDSIQTMTPEVIKRSTTIRCLQRINRQLCELDNL